MLTLIIGVKFGEKRFFSGQVILDSLFTLMCLFIVTCLFISMRRIRAALQRMETAQIYIDQRVVNKQLTVFLIFLVAYVVQHAVNDT
jgi:small basic protein